MVRAFILIPKLLWRLLIYDVSTCKVEAIERKISIVVRKWLALQLSLSDVPLHCKKAKLVSPFRCVSEEYRWQRASFDDAAEVCRPSCPESPTWAQKREEVESEQHCRFCPGSV